MRNHVRLHHHEGFEVIREELINSPRVGAGRLIHPRSSGCSERMAYSVLNFKK